MQNLALNQEAQNILRSFEVWHCNDALATIKSTVSTIVDNRGFNMDVDCGQYYCFEDGNYYDKFEIEWVDVSNPLVVRAQNFLDSVESWGEAQSVRSVTHGGISKAWGLDGWYEM